MGRGRILGSQEAGFTRRQWRNLRPMSQRRVRTRFSSLRARKKPLAARSKVRFANGMRRSSVYRSGRHIAIIKGRRMGRKRWRSGNRAHLCLTSLSTDSPMTAALFRPQDSDLAARLESLPSFLRVTSIVHRNPSASNRRSVLAPRSNGSARLINSVP